MIRLLTPMLLPFYITLALIAQSLLPASVTIAAKAGYDVSALLCSPSGKAPSESAKNHMKGLLSLIDDRQAETPNMPKTEHCGLCVVSIPAALNTPEYQLTRIAYSERPKTVYHKPPLRSQAARGPPLGGRAPPIFL